MIRNTANVSFYCRESKKYKDGVAPIEMSLIINGKRCFVQLPRKEVPEDIRQIKDGQYYIRDRRNKTGVYYTAVILEDGVRILKKYGNKLPMITNHKANAYLKTIRDICGIEKPIFSHVARHTYATRCLNRGIRLEVVARMLGHSTPKITHHYAKLLGKNILSEVSEAFDKTSL